MAVADSKLSAVRTRIAVPAGDGRGLLHLPHSGTPRMPSRMRFLAPQAGQVTTSAMARLRRQFGDQVQEARDGLVGPGPGHDLPLAEQEGLPAGEGQPDIGVKGFAGT